MSDAVSNNKPLSRTPKITIVSLTDAGQNLGLRLQRQFQGRCLDSQLLHKPQPFAATVQKAFLRGDRLLLICATGIAVRVLAPVLENKHQDPAVLVLDELGQFVVPLLSGHEGGANQWGHDVSEMIQARLVLTTANDYLKPVYTVGMGCERHCPESALMSLLTRCLEQANLAVSDLSSLNSIAVKADEVGLIELGHSLACPFNTWDVDSLRAVESQLSERSEYVFSVVGVYGVAESAAIVGAGDITQHTAELVLSKQKSAVATCAIARSYALTD